MLKDPRLSTWHAKQVSGDCRGLMMVLAAPPELTWRLAGPWQDSQPTSLALFPWALMRAWSDPAKWRFLSPWHWAQLSVPTNSAPSISGGSTTVRETVAQEMAVRIAATNPTNRTMGARWSFIGRGRPRPWMDPWIGNRWRHGDNARGEWGKLHRGCFGVTGVWHLSGETDEGGWMVPRRQFSPRHAAFTPEALQPIAPGRAKHAPGERRVEWNPYPGGVRRFGSLQPRPG